jgi:hypothetical protein
LEKTNFLCYAPWEFNWIGCAARLREFNEEIKSTGGLSAARLGRGFALRLLKPSKRLPQFAKTSLFLASCIEA